MPGLKLHVGGGDNFFPGFLNIGLFSEEVTDGTTKLKKGKIVERDVEGGTAKVLNQDFFEELPVSKEEVSFIYSSHMVEHLGFEDGRKFFQRCYDLLERGGSFRVVFPDFRKAVDYYIRGKKDFFDKYSDIVEQVYDHTPETYGELMAFFLHKWGHKWVYDTETVVNLMRKTGFREVAVSEAGETVEIHVKLHETANDLRRMESGYVVGIK